MLLGTFVVLGAVGAVGGVFALQALEVRDDLLAAKEKLGSLTDAYKAGDTAQLQAVGTEVLELTTRADTTVQGPLWDAASALPVVGENVAAVKLATEATHIIVRDALPPGIELLSIMSPAQLKLEGGGVNLAPLQQAQQTLPQIKSVLAQAQGKISGIDRAGLLPIVDGAVGQLIDVVGQAGPLLDTAEQYLPVALQLAGSEGPRRYIVLFQNNAEIRATGGNGATSTVIEIDNGRVTKLEDEQVAEFLIDGITGRADQNLPDATRAMFERDLTNNTMNYPRLADFPTVAQMYTALWQQSMGSEIDGVISLDPVVLSYMLAATGPIPLDDGAELTSENAVQLLLSETYERFGMDGLAADAYFADVSGRVFDTVSSGAWDPMTMITQVQRGVAEQRIYAWFARPAEQAMVAEQNIDGALATDTATSTQVGVFLNDASYSKLEYYLSTATSVTCDAQARTITTTLSMTNSIPGSDLSGYTLAWRNASLGLPRTTMILDVFSYALPGGTITSDPESGDFAKWTRTGAEVGREGKSVTMLVPMGETKTVSFTSTIPEGELGPLEVRYSPTVTQTPVTIDASCEGLFG